MQEWKIPNKRENHFSTQRSSVFRYPNINLSLFSMTLVGNKNVKVMLMTI